MVGIKEAMCKANTAAGIIRNTPHHFTAGTVPTYSSVCATKQNDKEKKVYQCVTHFSIPRSRAQDPRLSWHVLHCPVMTCDEHKSITANHKLETPEVQFRFISVKSGSLEYEKKHKSNTTENLYV